jgi:YfiR/HmsC-like
MKARDLLGWRGVAVAITAACALGPAASARGVDTVGPQADLRATAIARIRHYVTWPAGASGEAITTCVLGNDPTLAGALRRQSTLHGPLDVRELDPTSPELGQCQIAVFHDVDAAGTAAALRSLRAARALTIGESTSFVRDGGMLALVERRQRLRMVVSLANTRRAGLVLSSRLLQLAQVVDWEAR